MNKKILLSAGVAAGTLTALSSSFTAMRTKW